VSYLYSYYSNHHLKKSSTKFNTMKTTVLFIGTLFLLSVLLSGCATMNGVPAPNELRTYENIIEVPSKLKNELYVDVNSWFVQNFNSAESVIEFQDKEVGKIMGKYVFSYNEGIYYYDVRQTISIDVKDYKVRLVINEPYFKTTGDALNGNYAGQRNYQPLVSQKGVERARIEWDQLAGSLAKHLSNSSNW